LEIQIINDGYWLWIQSDNKTDYIVTGKYLFFSENQNRLIEIAKSEIMNYGFHLAKTNTELLENFTEYVLCLYYKDDSRKHELAERHTQQYNDVKYRYWKSDLATLRGEYSEEFLNKLNEESRKRFQQS
jgi:hypothetical protein